MMRTTRKRALQVRGVHVRVYAGAQGVGGVRARSQQTDPVVPAFCIPPHTHTHTHTPADAPLLVRVSEGPAWQGQQACVAGTTGLRGRDNRPAW